MVESDFEELKQFNLAEIYNPTPKPDAESSNAPMTKSNAEKSNDPISAVNAETTKIAPSNEKTEDDESNFPQVEKVQAGSSPSAFVGKEPNPESIY